MSIKLVFFSHKYSNIYDEGAVRLKKSSGLPYWFEEAGRMVKISLVVVFGLLLVFQVQIYGREAEENPLLPEASPLSEVLPVNYSEERLFANICLEVLDCASLPLGYVLINGRRAGDFGQKEVTIRVYENDLVEIDSSAYQPSIRFGVKHCSVNLDQSGWSQDLRSREGKAVLGLIKFK
jgi:hypothetical protein